MRTLKASVGKLKVTVVEAADLQATDPNGRSDPFCVVKLGDAQEYITDVRPATLNPKGTIHIVHIISWGIKIYLFSQGST